jgi:hypothetical protein
MEDTELQEHLRKMYPYDRVKAALIKVLTEKEAPAPGP